MRDEPLPDVVEHGDATKEAVVRRVGERLVHGAVERYVVVEALGQPPTHSFVRGDHLQRIAEANDEAGLGQQIEVPPERGHLDGEGRLVIEQDTETTAHRHAATARLVAARVRRRPDDRERANRWSPSPSETIGTDPRGRDGRRPMAPSPSPSQAVARAPLSRAPYPTANGHRSSRLEGPAIRGAWAERRDRSCSCPAAVAICDDEATPVARGE